MADQTHGAVDSLLGLLSAAIKDEARLLGGVQGDMQFIKDEMDSMNGFLLHLTKTGTEHNDQLRAWMKQVRDIAYIAQDCIELYMRDLSPPERGLWALLRHIPVLLWTIPARHRLATKIRELKVRVRDVGERRLRYGITVPDRPDAPLKPKPVGQDSTTDEKREDFLRALEDDHKREAPSPTFSTAIGLLPSDLASEAHEEISAILKKCVPYHVDSIKMLLRALYAYPYGTKVELANLEKKLRYRAADVRNEVMIFCYSKLSTHYKSCLQYLTAFVNEKSISRTSLVRRWVAEGLVAKDEGFQTLEEGDEGLHTLEETGERCFNELVFRGFVCPVDVGATGKVKSCRPDKSVLDFIVDISKSENFVAGLPTHLRYQLEIRKKVQPQRQQQPQQPQKKPWLWNICDLGGVPRKSQDDSAGDSSATADSKHPMDEIVNLLKSLPKEYRLNVMDLGGCGGLEKRHLKSICKVLSIKYLSIRNTNVSRLPKQINNLRQLETLDIRQTQVRPTDTEHIFLPKLKHLLAGRIDCPGGANGSLSTVRMPRKVGRNTEILCHVHVLRGEDELEQVGHLKQLRKLGVVLEGSEGNMKHLLRAIDRLSGRLRSLSVWITQALTDGGMADLDSKKEMGDATIFPPPTRLQSLNIKSCRLPSWIEDLEELAKITLRDTQLTENGLRKLGKLQSLRCLRLRHSSYTEPVLTLQKEEFQNLKFLLIEVSITTRIAFEAGAAPELEKIVWTFDRMEITSDTISGISNLPSLKEFELNGDCNTDPVRHAIAEHPNFPVFKPNPRVQRQEARNAGAAATP